MMKYDLPALPLDLHPKRLEVLNEAKTWIGTRYEHGQRCKGAGVDCGQLLLGVYHNAGCIPNITTVHYPPDFHIHQDLEWYKSIVEEWADEISSTPDPADVALYRLGGRVYSHGSVVWTWPIVIHALRGDKLGVMPISAEQGFLRNHDVKFFRPKAFL